MSKVLTIITHEATESVEGTRDPGLWVDFDQDVLLRVNVDLEETGSIEWTVHQHQKTLSQEEMTMSRTVTAKN